MTTLAYIDDLAILDNIAHIQQQQHSKLKLYIYWAHMDLGIIKFMVNGHLAFTTYLKVHNINYEDQ